jgi:hypothetical protein
MAGHRLIAAQLAILADRLPAQAVEELADGLQEAYETRLAEPSDPDTAARAAIADFGDADTITAAFIRESPWRRMAPGLLATGPFMGAVWGLTLLSGQVWDRPIPWAVRIVYGAALIAIVLTLLTVTREERAYRRTRTAMLAAAFGLMVLDGLALAALVTMAAAPGWAATLAATACLTRILATIRRIPAVLAG